MKKITKTQLKKLVAGIVKEQVNNDIGLGKSSSMPRMSDEDLAKLDADRAKKDELQVMRTKELAKQRREKMRSEGCGEDHLKEQMQSGDEEAARELRLFIDNDGELYKSQYLPIIKNLQRKIERGVYDPDKAPKLWMYLVNNGAKKYLKLFGSPGDRMQDIFPKPVREAVAEELARYAEEEYLDMGTVDEEFLQEDDFEYDDFDPGERKKQSDEDEMMVYYDALDDVYGEEESAEEYDDWLMDEGVNDVTLGKGDHAAKWGSEVKYSKDPRAGSDKAGTRKWLKKQHNKAARKDSKEYVRSMELEEQYYEDNNMGDAYDTVKNYVSDKFYAQALKQMKADGVDATGYSQPEIDEAARKYFVDHVESAVDEAERNEDFTFPSDVRQEIVEVIADQMAESALSEIEHLGRSKMSEQSDKRQSDEDSMVQYFDAKDEAEAEDECKYCGVHGQGKVCPDCYEVDSLQGTGALGYDYTSRGF